MSILIRYGFFAFPAAISLLMMQVFLPTYLAEQGVLGLTTIGVTLLAARLIDTFTDPLIGYLSDRTPLKLGRRRLWITLGTPIFLGVFWLLLKGPSTGLELFLLAAAWYTAGTCLIVPYYTWGAEIEEGYSAHNRFAAARVAMGLFGTLAALVLPVVITPNGETRDLLNVNYSLACLGFLIGGLCLYTLPDDSEKVSQGLKIREAFSVFRRRSRFNQLIFSQLINGTANALPASLFPLFAAYILNDRTLVGPLLILYFLSAAAATPFWVWLSNHWSKEKCWRVAMTVAGIVFLFTFFVDAGTVWVFFVITFITGVMAGADLSLPASMLADLIDHDEYETGVRRPGVFFAIWGMTTKLTFALAIGIAFPILGASVLDSQKTDLLVDESWLLALYAIMPASLKLLSVWWLRDYDLPKDAHTQVLDALHKKRQTA